MVSHQKKARSNLYPTETMINVDYADYLAFLTNTPAQAKFLQHSLEQAAGGIDLHVNANKNEFMCFKQEGVISTRSGKHLKLVDKFTYLGSNISSIESNVNIHLAKVWTAIDRLLFIRKSYQSHKIKWDFFQAVAVFILLYGCTTWTLTKHIKEKLDGNYSRMLHAVLNKSLKQHSTKQLSCCHLPPISQSIQVRQIHKLCSLMDSYTWTC